MAEAEFSQLLDSLSVLTPEQLQQLSRELGKRLETDRIDGLLEEGLQSGEPIPVTPEFWAERKRLLAERCGRSAIPQ